MARFDVYEVKAEADVPLVVDVQADFLEDLRTRVVVPLLALADAEDEVATRLKPIVDIGGKAYVLMTTDLGVVPRSALSERVASIERQRQAVVDAIYFLFRGF